MNRRRRKAGRRLTGFIFAASLVAGAPCLAQPSMRWLRPWPDSTQSKGNSAGSPLAGVNKLLKEGHFDEALSELETLHAKEPDLKGIDREFGIAYYKKGDYLKAMESLKKALAENPDDGEAIQLTGLSLYLVGRPAEAIPYLEKVQSWYPSANVDAAYILGVAYIQTKNYPQARAAFAKMFGVPAESASAYLFTARMLLRYDFGPIAEEYGKKAEELDPKLPLAHELLGELYLYQSKIQEAITQLEQELAINPGSAITYYKLADAYSRVERFDDAERLLQRSIWLDPNSTGPFILLGKVLEKKGESALAVRALQRAIAMDAKNPIPHHLLGQAYRDLGREQDAERELKLAEQLQDGGTAKP